MSGAWSSPWMLVAVASLVLVAMVTTLVLVRLAVGFSLVLRAETSGAWAFVMGASLLGFAATLVAAEGVPAHVVLFVLGKRWKSFTLAELQALRDRFLERRKRRRKAAPKPEKIDTRPWHQRGAETLAILEQWVDPLDGMLSLFETHRRVRLAWMNIDVQFGAEDPTITGQLTGLLYVLDTFLPPRVRLVAMPDWEPQNRLALSIQGRVFAWPVRLTFDLLRLVFHALVRRTKHALGLLPRDERPHRPPAELEAPAPPA